MTPKPVKQPKVIKTFVCEVYDNQTAVIRGANNSVIVKSEYIEKLIEEKLNKSLNK